MILKIFLTLSLILGTQCLLESQVGLKEWSQSYFGEVSDLQVVDKQYFNLYNEQGIYKIFSRTGDINCKIIFDGKKVIAQNQYSTFLFDEEQFKISHYDNLSCTLVNDFIIEEKIMAIEFIGHNYYMVSENKFYYFMNKSLKELDVQNEKILKLIKTGSQIFLAVLEKNNIKVYEFLKGKLEASFILPLQGKFYATHLYVDEEMIMYSDVTAFLRLNLATGDFTPFNDLICDKAQNLGTSHFWCEYDKEAKIYNVERENLIEIHSYKFEDISYSGLVQSVYQINSQFFQVKKLDKLTLNVQIFDFELKQFTNSYTLKLQNGYDKIKIFTYQTKEGYAFFLQSQNLQTYLFFNETQVWMKEESLSAIVASHFVSYETGKIDHRNMYEESLETHGAHNFKLIHNNFLLRLMEELFDLRDTLVKSFNYIKHLSTGIKDLFIKQSTEHSGNEFYNLQYNLQQIIMVFTKYNTMFALDSQNGEQLFRININENLEFVSFQTLQHRENDVIRYQNLVIFKTKENKEIYVSEIEIEKKDIKRLQIILMEGLQKTIKVPLNPTLHEEGLIFFDSKQKMNFYPKNIQQYFYDNQHKFHFYEQKDNQIQGHSFKNLRYLKNWSFTLPKDETILMIKSNEQSNSQTLSLSINGQKNAIPQEKSVLFKAIDNNNFAVISKSKINNEQTIMNLYVVNGVTGRILTNQYVIDVDFEYPINLLYSENNIFVTYFNRNTLKYEIWVIESYENEIQTSFIDMLNRFYLQEQKFEPKNYQNQELNIIFMQQKYGFSMGIKKLAVFKSKFGITKKNLIIITPQDQIYSLDRDLVSARRKSPENKQHHLFQSEVLPPYTYDLPINPQKIITYNLSLQQLENIQMETSALESTSLMFVYGKDIFFKSFSPENTFDKLDDDFNYPLLLLTILFVVALTVFMRHMAKNSKINKYFL